MIVNMLAVSQGVKAKLRTFFTHFSEDSGSHLYGVLMLELDKLASETSQLPCSCTDDISVLLHKYKGVCRCLKIDNELLYSDVFNKVELLEGITTLQMLLKEINGEV